MKYWAEDDVIRLHDVEDYAPPVDDFKKEHVPQSNRKFQVHDKVTNISHWKNSDKCSDVQFKQGFKPNLKWSDQQQFFLCVGKNKNYRTFDKLINNQIVRNKEDEIKEIEMEKTIIS